MANLSNTPLLRFPNFNELWEEKSLGELLEFKNGINADKEQYGKGAKFINVLDILNSDFITYDSIIGRVNVDEKILDKYSVNYGDILFQRSSETREEVGTANVYLDKNHTATFGGFVIRGRKIGEYEPYFLNKLLQTDSARKDITSKSGGSTRYNVGQETLSSVVLRFPPLPEQQKIASFLTAVDEKIQGLKRKKSLLEQYKKGVMQQLFSQEIRFKDENGNDYPDWEVKKLGEVASNVMYGLNAASKEFDGENKYIRITDIDDNSRTFINDGVTSPDCELDDKYLLKEGDLLFARTGASVGKSYLYNYKDGKVYFAGFLIRFSLKDNIPYFIFQQTLQPSYNKWVTKMSMRSGQPGINAEEYKSFPIILPCIEEQTKIANFLSAIDEKIEKEDARIKQAEVWKKGLLQQLFV